VLSVLSVLMGIVCSAPSISSSLHIALLHIYCAPNTRDLRELRVQWPKALFAIRYSLVFAASLFTDLSLYELITSTTFSMLPPALPCPVIFLYSAHHHFPITTFKSTSILLQRPRRIRCTLAICCSHATRVSIHGQILDLTCMQSRHYFRSPLRHA
jgi:hypothetical protein